MVVHPEELIATILLPLPDAIPLTDGTVLPTYRQPEHATIQMLEPWIDQLWLQAVDGSGIVPCRDMLLSEECKSARINWSNKITLITSIHFHQTFSDAGLRLGLEPAMRIATVISGPRITAAQKANALDEQDARRHLDTAGLRDLGLGPVTVAECYVGLRLVGELPHLESPLTQESAPAPPFGPIDTDRLYPNDPAMWQWRILPPGAALDAELVERRVRNALEVALTELGLTQRAVHALRRTPTMIATLERLPFVVPVVLRRAGDIGDENAPAVVVMLATRPHFDSLLPPDPLTEEETRVLGHARQRINGGPFTTHVDAHREAHVALARQGDHRLAGLLLGIAAESLLDELVLHLAWEEGQTPEHVAQTWIEGLSTRVRQELPRRLGGPWDVTRRNPIGIWAQDVASLRHRVAHGAYAPNEAEARRSFDGVNALVSHLCDRLASAEVLKKYPRTGLALAGETGLRTRSAYTKRVRELQGDSSEVPWTETYQRWREAWRRCRQDLTAQPRVPDETGAWLIAVCHPDHSLRWVLHDRAQHLALEVDINGADVPHDLIKRITTNANLIHDGGNPSPISAAVNIHPVRTTHRTGAVWTEEYHHIPMTQVMVDGSDYLQPVQFGFPPSRP